MERPSALKKHWVLTQDAFDNLLYRLDSDPERAAEKYEDLRHGLITFFECRRSHVPEDLADETINRVARRLAEGKDIYAGNPASYFYGVARNVLKEHWDARESASASLEAMRPLTISLESGGQEAESLRLREKRLDCLERCLQGLASKDRDLISGYYSGETSVKVHNRKRLAERLGIPINALRIRALRIREKLEACVERCQGSVER